MAGPVLPKLPRPYVGVKTGYPYGIFIIILNIIFYSTFRKSGAKSAYRNGLSNTLKYNTIREKT
jgi:hypothetical protein